MFHVSVVEMTYECRTEIIVSRSFGAEGKGVEKTHHLFALLDVKLSPTTIIIVR